MGLIEELKEMDEEKKKKDSIVYEKAMETKDKKEDYIAKKRWLRNREKLKKILEEDNPELDKPILVKIAKPKNYSKYEDRDIYYSVLTKRTMEILKLIEEWRVELWKNDAKITYKRSYKKPSENTQETMRHIEEKVKKIYSSDEKNNKCIVAIDERILSPNGAPRKKHLPLVRLEDYNYGLSVDTKLKYALLANIGGRDAFQYISQKPEEIQNYETTIKDAETTIKDYEEMHPKQESDSKITFSTIKSAIKEHLLGKGER